MGQPLPASLGRLRQSAEGRAWLQALPSLVRACADQRGLQLGPPFTDAYVSLAMPARRPDGTEVVLKVQYPHRESEHEAEALALWKERRRSGAPPRLWPGPPRLLLERCVPGEPLSRREPEEALDALIGLLPRLWKPAAGGPFRTVAEEAASWAASLTARWEAAGRPFEAALVEAALKALAELPSSQSAAAVLVNQDLHPGNVLSARREAWLAIDPEPLCGEREFGAVPVVRSFEMGHTRAQVRQRLDRLSRELGLDRERVRRWTLAQAVAWSLGTAFQAQRAETARWLMTM